MQENKSYRTIIRKLHPTTNTAEIRAALENIGFQVCQITNVLHKSTKINLPIFFIDLESSEHVLCILLHDHQLLDFFKYNLHIFCYLLLT